MLQLASSYHAGKQKIKWFRAQYGFLKAKYAAEDFRRKLIAAGRVDNRRTERQIRLQHMAGPGLIHMQQGTGIHERGLSDVKFLRTLPCFLVFMSGITFTRFTFVSMSDLKPKPPISELLGR
eukprot:3817702-Amphidinium_carterae.1